MRGIGSMLHEFGGGSKESPTKYIGKKIKNAEFKDDTMTLEFEDGSAIDISDQGQSCCESRYMTCHDDVNSLIGQTLVGIKTKNAMELESNGHIEHEVVFLEIQGDKSSIQFATHNEHNGYYGGFGLNISEREI